ncbi:MAG: ADP-glyceromanno-heptose 6-epimerase [Alphaproteobacteria bacterium]|nr:ADP-glyceromanno-heptose 6-epimerase [Alphaproteobacteria bacterium]
MIVVTGGAGFIGSNLVAALEARGESETMVCDRMGKDERWQNLRGRELSAIVPPERLFDFLRGNEKAVDVVFHMGAISDTTETDAGLLVENNYLFPLALWDWCAAHDVRFLYASSAATYGDGSAGFDDDATSAALAKLKPLNAYGWSKHLFDRRVARMLANGANRPRQWAGLKFFNVYGPNEYHKGGQRSVVHQAWGQATTRGDVTLFRSHRDDVADGEQARDFIYVDDAVDVMLWLLDHPNVSGLFNLGTGKARTFKDLANAVFAALQKKPNIRYIDTPETIRAKYQYFTEAPMQRLRAAGYARAFTSLEEGVRRYVQDFLAKPSPYR